MVMMVHYLAVLPAGVSVTELSENWRGQVKNFDECRLQQWVGAPRLLDARPKRQLDWGTWAHELEDGDLPVIARQSVIEKLPPLAAGERRVALWVECY